MLTRRLFRAVFLFFLCSAFAPVAFCQIAPPDPLEPVNEPATLLSTVEERTNAINLLDKARRNYRSASGGHPFTLNASFTATGQTAFEGDGHFQMIVHSKSWRMEAQLGRSTTIRLVSGGHTYGNSATEPIPLRILLLWTAIFNPIDSNGAMGTLRSVSVNYKGQKLTCVLVSGSVPRIPAPRYYQEHETCVDAESGLLKVWSEKPGIYADYDYTGAIDFHGNIMARQITITEAGTPTLQIHIDSLRDATPEDEALLRPGPPLVTTFNVSIPNTFPLRVPPSEGEPPDVRVIVHAAIDANDGHVLEAEALQSWNPQLAQAAIEAVKAVRFAPTGLEREAFINVMFDLPMPHR
jgi:hypothetical protein